MRNPYEYPNEWEAGGEPDEHPLYCRLCHGYLGDYETATPAQVAYWNGWPHCPEHAEEMRRLEKSPDPVNEVRR